MLFWFWCHWSPWQFSHCFKEEPHLGQWVTYCSHAVTLETYTDHNVNDFSTTWIEQSRRQIHHAEFLFSPSACHFCDQCWFLWKAGKLIQEMEVCSAFCFLVKRQNKSKIWRIASPFVKLSFQKTIRRLPVNKGSFYRDITYSNTNIYILDSKAFWRYKWRKLKDCYFQHFSMLKYCG